LNRDGQGRSRDASPDIHALTAQLSKPGKGLPGRPVAHLWLSSIGFVG
jgi:hypothetical protein